MIRLAGRMLLVFLFLSPGLAVYAEEEPDYYTVGGIVRDKQTKRRLGYAAVYLPGTNVGTIANVDGEFSLKIKHSWEVEAVMVSHLGYASFRLPVSGESIEKQEIYLEPQYVMLGEALIRQIDPVSLMREAMRRRADNYEDKSNLLTGFYRETIQKRRTFINVSEAVVNVFKTPYTEDVEQDYVQIYKGRRIITQKASDTLLVKLLGGPHLPIFVDVVKNKNFIMDVNIFTDYQFAMEEPAVIDNRPQFVVAFKPQIVLPYALHHGKFYIDQNTFTFTRAEIFLSMDDKNKATQAILRKKPFGLRFKPLEVSYEINYKEHQGRSYLYYVRNEVHFRCDWKRKLFSTSYRVVSEMVTTDRREFTQLFRLKMSDYQQIFRPNQIFSDRVQDFYDPGFWENYNIIEPTESLESGINRLRKQLE